MSDWFSEPVAAREVGVAEAAERIAAALEALDLGAERLFVTDFAAGADYARGPQLHGPWTEDT